MTIIKSILFLTIFLFNFEIQAFPLPEDKKASFDIIRKNKIIGSYEILFSKENEDLIIETNVDILYKKLFIVFYSFSHYSKEIWRNHEFVEITGNTKFEDEREYDIKGKMLNNTFIFSGMDGESELENNLIPSNYWNQNVMFQDEIFDTQKGIIRKINVNHKGEETIIINDKKIDCIKFILNASKHPKDKGPFSETTLWYSKDKELMKFNFKNPKDSSIIHIVRKK